MTPIGSAVEMKEGSTNHDDRRVHTTCKACRDINYRVTNGLLHEAGSAMLWFIWLDFQKVHLSSIVTVSKVGWVLI
jgi:hypothetical protein